MQVLEKLRTASSLFTFSVFSVLNDVLLHVLHLRGVLFVRACFAVQTEFLVHLKELRRTATKCSPVDVSHSAEAWRKKRAIGHVGAESNNEKITAVSEAAQKNVLKVNVQQSRHTVCGSCLLEGTIDHFLCFHFP